MLVLLTDFGASRIKAAVGDTVAGRIILSKDYPAGTPVFSPNRHCEVPLAEIQNALKRILSDFADFDVGGLMISSEMHGFLIADQKNTSLTDYISWKDERCLNAYGKKDYFTDLNEKIANSFRDVSGMTPRPCFPLYNVFAFLRENTVTGPVKVLTLPDYLASLFQDVANQTHITMAAGLGFFNVRQKRYEQDFVDVCGRNLSFNRVTEHIVPAAV